MIGKLYICALSERKRRHTKNDFLFLLQNLSRCKISVLLFNYKLYFFLSWPKIELDIKNKEKRAKLTVGLWSSYHLVKSSISVNVSYCVFQTTHPSRRSVFTLEPISKHYLCITKLTPSNLTKSLISSVFIAWLVSTLKTVLRENASIIHNLLFLIYDRFYALCTIRNVITFGSMKWQQKISIGLGRKGTLAKLRCKDLNKRLSETKSRTNATNDE